jgi:hypothetical protein
MPRSYEGNTWVAFLDMSGFKEMMKNTALAEASLDRFYNTVYRAVFQTNHDFPPYPSGIATVNSLIVSDCSVIFVDNSNLSEDKVRDLHLVLYVIWRINRDLIRPVDSKKIMTTSAVAYGPFKFLNRNSDFHTEKNFFYGDTYLKAYLGNEDLRKKPGFCRVLTTDLSLPSLDQLFPLNLLKKTDKHYDFYWMLDTLEGLPAFSKAYDSLSRSIFDQMANLLFNNCRKQNME